MAKTIISMFDDRDNAEKAINRLEARGYNPKDVSIVIKDKSEANELKEDTGAGEVVEGATAGATTGALLGGLAGLLASTVLPGLGAFLIGGPIAAALGLGGAAASTVSGAVTGAAAGGLIGALSNAFGLSEEEARGYESGINEGGILVAIPARFGDEDEVRDILSDSGGSQIKSVDSSAYRDRREDEEYQDREERYSSSYASEVSKDEDRDSKGKGWHGDSRGHSKASRGEEVDDDK